MAQSRHPQAAENLILSFFEVQSFRLNFLIEGVLFPETVLLL